MISIEQVTKKFGDVRALDQVEAQIGERSIFGLAGTNGAGKSTLLRVICGVLRPEEGQVKIDGLPVWENPAAKRKLCFIPDAAWFFPNATSEGMRDYYSVIYPQFDRERFDGLMEQFGLDPRRKIQTFSKGMKKQVSVLLGICTNTEYLLCDETFDGLDPVMRQAVKSLFASEILNRTFTPVIASHSLREIEDICDHVGLLHRGGILFSRDLDDMKLDIHKVQCVIPDPLGEEDLLRELEVLQHSKRGSLLTIIARGSEEEVQRKIMEKQPLFSEILPLSLEEIFISETEVAGYDVKNLIF
ncbi:MAG: ABC transporter ATP-binding protein [Lachnospiraceae bacterium]|nr:ABC transporter ATP-binding protein [Lachnospiraceae bacterium]